MTKTIPIVFAAISDPLGSGLVSSLAHPGGNTTGVSEGLDNTILKHLDLIRSTPRLSKIGVLINPSNPLYARLLESIESVGQGLGITVVPVYARSAEEIEGAFGTLKSRRVLAALIFDDSFFFTQRQQLADMASRFQLPASLGIASMPMPDCSSAMGS